MGLNFVYRDALKFRISEHFSDIYSMHSMKISWIQVHHHGFSGFFCWGIRAEVPIYGEPELEKRVEFPIPTIYLGKL